ncbi:MAG: SDR family NAD(P)-dependent oxidoreductase, partial [Terriglobales bacterium]
MRRSDDPGYALVTGASRGLGEAFAEALARRGSSLILTGRSTEDLERVRRRVQRPGIEVHCLAADLAGKGAAEVLEALARNGWAVDLLVNNAGLGSVGPFAANPLGRELEEVAVNVRAVVELTHGCLAGMRARGRGGIIMVSSVAASQPVPRMATYAASKAFDLRFSLALYAELRAEGIHVMALCPGVTRTNFFPAAGIRPRGAMHEPEFVVERALRGFERRRAVVVTGAGNRM